jgi:cell division protein FtsB
MRVFSAALLVVLVLLQYRLWVSDQGVREVSRLQTAIAAQAGENREQSGRNRQLVAEVANLKEGLNALEERARSELGMIGSNETFYQVVNGAPVGVSHTATPITARAQ